MLSGEASSVNTAVVGDWLTENVPDILEKYAPSNIYNADESGLFYQTLKDCSHEFRRHASRPFCSSSRSRCCCAVQN